MQGDNKAPLMLLPAPVSRRCGEPLPAYYLTRPLAYIARRLGVWSRCPFQQDGGGGASSRKTLVDRFCVATNGK